VGRVLGRSCAIAAIAFLAVLGLGAHPASAVDRCAAGDPFNAQLRDDIARRFGGHNITATAYDQRTGCLWHLNPGRRVGTASVVKVEVGAGVLLRAQQAGRGLTSSEAARLWPMITESSNPPTTSLWTELGGAPAMARLDRTFGLTETTPAAPSWGLTTTTADDQIRLLRQVVLGERSPLDAAHRAPLVKAMGAVVPSQRWGVSAGAPKGSDVRLKNGFASSPCCAWRINSVGVVTTGGHSVALAVLSDHWPNMGAGIEAVELVSRAINAWTTRPRWIGVTGAPPRAGTIAASSDGRVAAAGGLTSHGDVAGLSPNAPVVGLATTPSGEGTWLAGADGGVFAFGDAPFLGSLGATKLNQPIVGIDGSATGQGYRMAASDGGVFAYGDAPFLGSMGATPLNAPVVGIASTPSGQGYWLVALDGGIFAYGDAGFWGSTGAMTLNAPIVGMEVSPSGAGYWLAAADGGVFAFGDAPFVGAATDAFPSPLAGIARTPAGLHFLAEDGSALDRP
jgi:hypothetical protein